MSTGRPPVLDERTVERLLTGQAGPADPDLQRVLGLLRSMGSEPAPRPSPALAELLTTGFEPAIVPQPRPALRRRPWVLRATAGLAAAAASLVVAGTAQALPAPVQHGLAGVVRALTPFELPDSRSTDDGPATDGTGTPAGRPPAAPAPAPAPAGRDGGIPAPSSDPGPGDGATGGAGTTAGDGAGGQGSAVPTRGPDLPRPPAPPRDEPGRAVPEAPSSRQEPGPAPVPSGSEGSTGTTTRPGTPDPATTEPAQPGPGAAPEARGQDVAP